MARRAVAAPRQPPYNQGHRLPARGSLRRPCNNNHDRPPAMPPLHLTYALMVCCYTSISSARVILSLFALELGASASAVGLLVATFYAFPLVLSWPVGVLADRLGSRGLLVCGAFCGAAGMAIPYFFQTLPALYVSGFALGLSFTVYNVLLQNLVGLASTPQTRTRNFSDSSMFGAASLFLGPLAGGRAIDHFSAPVACLCSAALAVAAIVLLLVFGSALPGAQGAGDSAPRGRLRDLLNDRGIEASSFFRSSRK